MDAARHNVEMRDALRHVPADERGTTALDVLDKLLDRLAAVEAERDEWKQAAQAEAELADMAGRERDVLARDRNDERQAMDETLDNEHAERLAWEAEAGRLARRLADLQTGVSDLAYDLDARHPWITTERHPLVARLRALVERSRSDG